MFKIAIVEDNGAAAEKLHGFLTRYATENNETFDITVFGDAVSFLDNYKSIYDMVFMDIELPYIDGMEAAKRLRALPSTSRRTPPQSESQTHNRL